MAALGLSLIFGTTGLTNFAHGELVTFGALVAWYINAGPACPLIAAALIAMIVVAGWSGGSTTARCGGRCGAAAPA